MSIQIYDIHGETVDITKIGFNVFWSRGGRVTAVRHSRWQGSIDSVKLTFENRLSLERARELAEELSKHAEKAYDFSWPVRRGQMIECLNYCNKWRVTHAGYEVH